jgi:plasmid stabilization system protein ParE
VRLRWSDPALADLGELADRAPAQAAAVVRAAEWLAHLKTPAIGRYIPEFEALYWPVPPQGIVYNVEGDEVIIERIRDSRRRLEPW